MYINAPAGQLAAAPAAAARPRPACYLSNIYHPNPSDNLSDFAKAAEAPSQSAHKQRLQSLTNNIPPQDAEGPSQSAHKQDYKVSKSLGC